MNSQNYADSIKIKSTTYSEKKCSELIEQTPIASISEFSKSLNVQEIEIEQIDNVVCEEEATLKSQNCSKQREKTPPPSTDASASFTPPHIKKKAEDMTLELLPTKSKATYLKAYDSFIEWKKSEGVTSWSNDTMMSYFGVLSEKYSPTSLWKIYSMLKATIFRKHHIDIGNYVGLKKFVCKQGVGYQSKQAETFTSEEIQKFIDTATDLDYLVIKVNT